MIYMVIGVDAPFFKLSNDDIGAKCVLRHIMISCCLKYLRPSSSNKTRLRKYLTENYLSN